MFLCVVSNLKKRVYRERRFGNISRLDKLFLKYFKIEKLQEKMHPLSVKINSSVLVLESKFIVYKNERNFALPKWYFSFAKITNDACWKILFGICIFWKCSHQYFIHRGSRNWDTNIKPFVYFSLNHASWLTCRNLHCVQNLWIVLLEFYPARNELLVHRVH